MPTKAPKKSPKRTHQTRAKAAVAVPRSAERKAAVVPTSSQARPEPPSSASKQGQLIAKLSTTAGATMADLTALTGWQAHTVRGAISGALRKRLGLRVTLEKTAGGESRYRIQTPART